MPWHQLRNKQVAENKSQSQESAEKKSVFILCIFLLLMNQDSESFTK